MNYCPLFVILDVYGSYYNAPPFSNNNKYRGKYSCFDAGNTTVEILPYFARPQGLEVQIIYTIILL